MANNPLQKYFRQPKIFISLPSKGIYSQPGTIQGDAGHMPVYGMTGMDEIMLKTPDALLNGGSTAMVIESCCPGIKDGWDVSQLDIDYILAAIRIATYGNMLPVKHTCTNCSTENDYEIDLGKMIDHYQTCQYDNEVVVGDLKVFIRPLTYKESSRYSIENFKIQQQLKQVYEIEDEEVRKTTVDEIFRNIAVMQNEIYVLGIESVNIGNQVVTDKVFIKEWIENCDKEVFTRIKDQIAKNQDAWSVPKWPVICENCSTENEIFVYLDQSNFFGTA